MTYLIGGVEMQIGNATVRFPEDWEPHGRAPTIVIYAEGRFGAVLSAVPYALKPPT